MSAIPVAKALSSALSWKILDLLIDKNLGEHEIAKSLGTSLKIAKEKLAVLEMSGLVVCKEPSPGSTPTYMLTRNARSVGFPPRGYQTLTESIIAKLVDSMGQEGARMILRDIGIRIGEELGRSLLSMSSSTKWTPDEYASRFVNKFLSDSGLYPHVRSVGKHDLIYEQSNCLFQELADKMPGLICDTLDEAVHEGIDSILGVRTERVQCKGHGDEKCVFCVKWKQLGASKV
ncbi:MAG: hypothetical protein JRN20_07625 [Nitrososphaerota archaeon]|jgi:predicted ArsR family transcriptional regulator|nr:hypothetical protein [Nitrososphaerota archaeon]